MRYTLSSLLTLTTLEALICLFLQEVAEAVKKDFGTIDVIVHSLANGPEVGT